MVSIAKIDKTIQLADTKRASYEFFQKKYFPDDTIDISHLDDYNDTYEYLINEEDERALSAYLHSLEYDEIKDLQTLMYVGRGDASEDGTGAQQFRALRAYFDERGWNKDRTIEIGQMTEKLPLGDYLKQGKEILGL